MSSLFAGTRDMEDVGEIYDQMKANCPHPSSNSKSLWKLRRATYICASSPKKETMLEKAVAMLADNCHMPTWFNQCPTASGITDSSRNKKSSVDLVHWNESTKHARLVELKWESNDPLYALCEVLQYGAAYVFCRAHRGKLPLQDRPLMDARHVALEVAAPAHYYDGCEVKVKNALAQMRAHLDAFDVGSRIDGLTMSLDALQFPEHFRQLPFKNGQEVKQKCGSPRLTPEGQKIRGAFYQLTPVA